MRFFGISGGARILVDEAAKDWLPEDPYFDDVFAVLEDEGIQKFTDSWDELTDSVRSELENKK